MRTRTFNAQHPSFLMQVSWHGIWNFQIIVNSQARHGRTRHNSCEASCSSWEHAVPPTFGAQRNGPNPISMGMKQLQKGNRAPTKSTEFALPLSGDETMARKKWQSFSCGMDCFIHSCCSGAEKKISGMVRMDCMSRPDKMPQRHDTKTLGQPEGQCSASRAVIHSVCVWTGSKNVLTEAWNADNSKSLFVNGNASTQTAKIQKMQNCCV